VQTPDSAAVQRPRLPHRCLLPQSFAVLCFAVAVVFFAVAVVVAFSPLPAVAVVGFVVAVVCVCRCLFCRCLRLPLSVFAVILSAAKDPDALHPPVPLEPFAHNRQPWQPAKPALRSRTKNLSSPQTRKTRANQGDSRGVVVPLHPLYWIQRIKKAPKHVRGFLTLKSANSFRKTNLPVTHLE